MSIISIIINFEESQRKIFKTLSVRGGPRSVRTSAGRRLGPPHLPHHAVLTLPRGQGCTGASLFVLLILLVFVVTILLVYALLILIVFVLFTFLTLWSQLSRAWKLCRKSECYFPTPELCNLGSNLWRHIASSLFYCNSCSPLHILVPMSC